MTVTLIERASALGLTKDELDTIVKTLGRDPSPAELAMYAAMWSEHCSYKSSKVHLKTLPTTGPKIVMGPGENAGVVDIGDGLVAVFKLESHNHPSAVEPVQGAATGVGGIVRDILATGARPVALLDPLRFGDPSEWRQRHLLGGVVAGIGQYGNSIGIPTVGGEIKFDPCYAGNPLVNVMCIGIMRKDLIARARAQGEGNVAILYGAKTGRDGIGGVSVLASRPFDAEAEAKRPSVQVGDPFSEKVAIEATLELLEQGLIVGVQDLGGAGFCCATSETASRGGVGMEVDLDAVLLREPDMEPFEILTSESQERMFAIVKPEDVERVLAVCERWGVDAMIVGRVTGGDRLVVTHRGEVVADVPARSLADDGPTYHRPMERPDWIDALRANDPSSLPVPKDLGEALLTVLGAPNVCDKSWAWEQYDFLVQHNTLQGPGGDGAVVRVEGTGKALVVATDGNGRYGQLDPRLGGMHAVAESARNVACTGARLLAITNCLNFGNPERADVMWQFAEAVAGMGEACLALETPVTGGNVSFYNETDGTSIHPTPIVGMLGILEDAGIHVGIGFNSAGDAIVVLGETFDELGGSEYAWAVHRHIGGVPPALDLRRETALCDLLATLAERRLISSAHDCSEGGLAVTIAESCIAGDIGARVTIESGLAPHVLWFSESASRAVVSCPPDRLDEVRAAAAAAGVPFAHIGTVGGVTLACGEFDLPVTGLRAAWNRTLPDLLA